jgi:hypothetical protein
MYRGHIAPKFNNKYVTYIKLNQSKSTTGYSFSSERIMEKVRISVNTSKINWKEKNLNWNKVTPGYGTHITTHRLNSLLAVTRLKVKAKAIPVAGPWRLPHFLYSRLTDGGKVSLTRRPPFTPQEDSWYSFLLETESTPRAIVRLKGLGNLKIQLPRR